ncbi:PREDICTED: uncharacterized protein LOC108558521 [Nicrophorus vespilloides]|uniref:Uncharacterized protein LOC108558521 n=1 Tax=Nicrophorus vespilloides TaxID=110193 RepID=A0ABM1M8P0_NICVS|nr:PREDICTED: uncharacterized protein LOC108558521 [Nicrophorus vespilloides]
MALAQTINLTSNPALDCYDEEFNRNLQLAKNLIVQLKRKQDREICSKWIAKLCDLKSTDPSVKKNRNQFFKYMLTVLHKGIDDAPHHHHGYPQISEKHGAIGDKMPGKSYMSRWSPDRRTYVAVKPMPGRGALVYMAVSKNPELGWEYHK